jgi:hypothetical protein
MSKDLAAAARNRITSGLVLLGLTVGGVAMQVARVAASAVVTTTYSYTGSTETFTVPAGVTSMTVTIKGGQGGIGGGDSQGSPTPGGYQGVVTGVIAVSPGDEVTVAVGGGGGTGTSSQGSAPGGFGGANPLPGYDGASGGVAGPAGSSGGGGGSGAASVLQIGTAQIVAGGAGGNGGNGQFLPIVGRRAEDSHVPRADATTSTNGRPGMDTYLVCSPGFRCDGGASGAGGGGSQGGEQGAVQYGGDTATEYFGFGGYPGANSTADLPGLTTSYEYYAGNSDDGSISIAYDDGAPGAPTNLAGTAKPGAVALVWHAPIASGASAITDYIIEYATDAGGPYTVAVDGVSTALATEVTGLTNGTPSYFRVTAVNSEGPGAPATTTIGIVPSDVPSPPTVTSLVAFGGGIVVNFTPGASDSPITGYDYRLDGGDWTTGAVSANQLTISGLTNGRAYSVDIRARNSVGPSLASTPAQLATPRDVAQAPTPLLAAASNAAIDLTWTAPTVNNGAAVTDYVVQTALSSGGTYSTFVEGTSTSTVATITGLTNGVTYYVRVAAVNAVGIGAWSTSAVATPYTAPNAPSIAVTPGDGSLTVDITPSFDGGSTVTGYEYRLGAGGSWTPTGSLLTTFAIASLANATSYDVYVRALNAAGASPASTVVSATPRTVPAAPAIATVALDTGAVSVSFTVGSDGGTPLTNVEYSIDGGSTWITRSPASMVSPVTIGSLVGGVTYPVRLRVVNAAGFSAPSNTSSVTAKGTPDAPVINVAGADHSLVLTFTAPANGGTPITNFEYSLDGGDHWTARSPAATSSPLVIAGLDNGTSYSVRWRAVNAVGSGASSTIVVGVPRTTPGAPSITTQSIVGSEGTLDVDFIAPVSDGGSAILTYQYSTDGGATWRDRQTGTTASPLHITTLSSNGTSPLVGATVYDVEIRAVNAAGAGVASAVASGVTTTVPHAPVIVTVDVHDASASVHFAPPANGGLPITKFEYRLDAGAWTDTGSLADEFVISGLTNGVTYSLVLRAVNSDGNGPASDAQLLRAFSTPAAPSLASIVPGDQSLAVAFTPGADGGSAITTYQYSTDGGTTWRTRVTGTVGSPLSITTTSEAGAATLTNGTIYAVQLRAVNAAGPGAASETLLAAPRGTPSAPTAVSVVATNGALVLSFTQGADGGSPITALEYQLGGGEWVDPGSLSSPLTVGSLNNGQLYSIAVRARNAVGPGAASTPVTGTPRTVPGAPIGVSAGITSHQVTVSWAAPLSNGGAAITGYTVSLFEQATGGTAIGTCTTNGTLTCTVNGLTNGITLYADVVAANTAGAGPASAPRLARMPLAPPQVTIASIVPGATDLSIAVNVVDGGGAPITAFEYQLDGGTWQSAASATSPFTISGLTTGVQYSIRIRAISAGGTGDPSPAVLSVPHTTPSVPTGLSAIGSDASATPSWTAPASNGGQPVTDYVVQYSTDALGPFTTFVDGTSPTTTATVTGLTNATAYVFRVAAVNTAGTGPWSALASATPLGASSAPTINTITPGSRFLQVAFTAPASNGGSVVTGYEYRLDNGTWRTASGTSSPLTITGLSNGQTYAVQLRGVNIVGGGTASAPVSAKPYGLPAAVVGFRASPSASSVTLAWDAVDDNGSPILAYNVIRWTAATEGGIAASFQTTATSQTFSGLTAGTYFFTIEASNLAGTGPRSAPRTTAIVGGTVPSAPTAISTSTDGADATITWTPGTAGTAAITNSIVQYSTDNINWTTMSFDSDPTSANFTLPSATTPYALRVAAISAVGVGPFATVHPPIAETGAASQLTSTSATVAGSVNANGAAVDVAFEVATTLADLGTSASTMVAATPDSVEGSATTAVSADLTDLLHGTSYVVRTVVTGESAVARGATSTFTTSAAVAQTITVEGLHDTALDGAPLVLPAVTSGNLPLTYTAGPSTVCTVAGTTVSFHGVGTCTVTADQAGDAGHLPATATGTFEVTAIVQIITISDLVDISIDAGPLQLAGTTSGGLPLDYSSAPSDVCTVSGTVLTLVGEGICTVTATQAGDDTHTPASATAGFLVKPRMLHLSLQVDAGHPVVDAVIVVNGEGLKPDSEVRIELYPSSVLLGTATTAGDGSVHISVTMPKAVSPGTHRIVATGIAPDGHSVTATEEIFVDWSGSLGDMQTSGGYTPLAAVRILDTREVGAQLTAGSEYRLTVPASLVADDVSSLVLNLTVTEAESSGFVSMYPCGTNRPLAAAINFSAGETKATLVDAVFHAGGALCLWSNVATDVVVDLQGFHSASGQGRLVPRTAVRLVDTRPNNALVASQVLQIQVVGDGKAAAGTIAVALNVAVDDPQRAGFLTVYPCDATRPWASNLNFVAGQTVSNEVMVQPAADGTVCVYTTAAIHLVVDLDGTYEASGLQRFSALVPGRLADTRLTTQVLGGQTLEWTVVGEYAAPEGTTALSLNIAVTEPEGAGFLTVYPCGTNMPLASNLNFAAGQTISNHVTATVGASGKICVFASRTTDLVIDVEGIYSPS